MVEKYNRPIITGQQIGLLGGPLYTTYKVIGAIKYAESLNTDAIYWLETNDADFEEINKIQFIDKENNLKTLKWEKKTNGLSTGEIIVDEELIKILNTFFDSLIKTEHTDNLRKIVLDSYKLNEKLKICSKNLANNLFDSFKLKYFDPTDEDFRKFSKNILLNDAKSTENGKQCNLFVVVKGVRKAVFKENNKFYFRDNLEVDIENSILVPNLQTRSVCQDAYFKTDTYIAGPGEISYLKTLDNQYKKHNVEKSKVKKRMSLTLIEPKTKRLMNQTGLDLDIISKINKQNIEQYLLKNNESLDLNQLIETTGDLTNNYIENIEKLGINSKEIKKSLKSLMKNELGKIRAEKKANLKSKIEKSHLIFDLIFPFSKKQERVFNIFYYMNLYGGKNFINFLYNNHTFEDKILEITK